MPSIPAALVLASAVSLAHGQGVAPSPSGTPPTWRESLDGGRERLAQHLWGLKLNAFGDLLTAPDEDGRTRTDWHVFELDATAELHDQVDLAAAFVTDRDGGRMTVGFLDVHPFGGTIAPRGRLWVEKGFHIQVGRFDVPFGNDWQFFASKDSLSISRPLTTDGIMEGGLNDVGVRVLGNDGTFNVNAYALRGFGEGRITGGRLGFTPFGNPFSLKEARDPKTLELGWSWFRNGSGDGRTEVAWAADAEVRLGAWAVRAEYVVRSREPLLVPASIRQCGWHLTQEYTWMAGTIPIAAFLRYERLGANPLESGTGDRSDIRIATGAAVTLAGLLQLKVEWQHMREATAATRSAPAFSPDVWLAQAVVVF